MQQEIHIDPAAATVTLKIDGTYRADQLLQLLKALGNARAQIHEEPFQLPKDATIEPEQGWGFLTTSTPDGHSLLALRHPGFGWIANKLPIQAAAQLAGSLNHQAVVVLAAVAQGLGKLITTKISVSPDEETPAPPISSGGGQKLH